MLNSNTAQNQEFSTSSLIEKVMSFESHRHVDQNYAEVLKKPYIIRVAVYLRVSTVKQADSKKVSLIEQEQAIRDLIIGHKDWEIVEVYNEKGKSGKEMETRDEFERMTRDGRQGKFDLIIGWSTDRMARNFEEMTAYRKEMRGYGVQVTSATEPIPVSDPRTMTLNFKSQDKIMSAILDWKAEADNESRTARFSLGKIGKAKKGLAPGKVPYGYRKRITYINGDPNNKFEEDVVIEEEAVVVRDIYMYYDQNGWGFRRIADELNHKGIPSPRKKLWGYSTIKYTLQNPSYISLIRWAWRLSQSKRSRTRLMQGHKGIITEGKQERIIDPDLFQRVQDKMAIRAKLGGRAVASRGLLSGLLYCGRCHGHTYLWTSKPTNKNYRYGAAYLCSNYSQHGTSVCAKRYVISKKKVETVVVEKIKELSNNPEAQEEFIKQSRSTKKVEVSARIKMIEGCLTETAKSRERVRKLLITQDFDAHTIEDFKNELTQLDLQEISQRKELESLNIEFTHEAETENMTREAILSLMDFDKIWESAELDRRKMLLATIIKKVVVNNEKEVYIEFNINN